MASIEPELWDLTMAFQPIVDVERQKIFAHEALVRRTDGSGAQDILRGLTDDTKFHFDNLCRSVAIRLAEMHKMSRVHINILPGALSEPDPGLQRMIEAADRYDFYESKIIVELSEPGALSHRASLRPVIDRYRREGFRLAIDNFGLGGGALQLLNELRPDFVKLHKDLVSASVRDRGAVAVLQGILKVAEEFEIEMVAEGVETAEVAHQMRDMGVRLQQGYLFSRPQVGRAVTAEEIPFSSFMPKISAVA